MPTISVSIQVLQIAKPEIVHWTNHAFGEIASSTMIDSPIDCKTQYYNYIGRWFLHSTFPHFSHLHSPSKSKLKNCLKLGISVKCIENQACVKTMPLA